MKTIKDYDRLVCTAVRNDPLGFIDILNDEANKSTYFAPLLREAACVIANLMDQLGIPEKRGICPDCGGYQYTANPHAAGSGCIYCKDGRVILDSEGTPPIKKEGLKDEQDNTRGIRRRRADT